MVAVSSIGVRPLTPWCITISDIVGQIPTGGVFLRTGGTLIKSKITGQVFTWPFEKDIIDEIQCHHTLVYKGAGGTRRQTNVSRKDEEEAKSR